VNVAVVAAAAAVAGLGVWLTGRTPRTRSLWWLAAGAAGAASIIALVRSPVPIAAGLMAGGLAAAAVVDASEGRIPTVLAHGTTLGSLVLLGAHAFDTGDSGEVIAACILTAGLVLGLGAVWLAGGMGFGDVRLASATVTAMVGGVLALATVAFVAYGAVGVTAVVTRRRHVRLPFGPALALGWLAAVAIG
jgi:prepilin signal peptidase PulO-like enzyme (type II secretory pathway)